MIFLYIEAFTSKNDLINYQNGKEILATCESGYFNHDKMEFAANVKIFFHVDEIVSIHNFESDERVYYKLKKPDIFKN